MKQVPLSGSVFLDTSPIIYAIEKIHPYATILQPTWKAASEGQIQLFGSELLYE